MKRLICFVMCAVYLSTVSVYANSAPSYWEAFPYSEVLVVEEDSPITVDREHLTFDFSEAYNDGDFHSPVGKVLAEYQMTNPTNETLSVQMAFPFVSNLSNLSISDITVRADGTAVPYEIYADPKEVNASGDSSEGFLYNYGTVGNISNQEWTLPGFDLDTNAKLYRYAISGKAEERLDFGISFDVDHNQTLLLGNGFDGASYSEEGSEKLSSRIREKTEAEILVLGKDPEFTYEVLTDEGRKADQERYQLEITQESVDPKQYLLAALRENIGEETAAAISDTQLLNLCLHEIWRECVSNGYSMLFEVFPAIHNDRIFTLVYQVEFPAKSTSSISVGYLTEGTMDRRETVSPTYSYTYLLSPAENWADFGSLDIEIITPPEAPYIIESSLTLEKDGENRYSARFDGLPQDELFFTLYENKKISFINKAERAVSQASYLLFFLWPVFLIVLIALMAPAMRSIIRRMSGL